MASIAPRTWTNKDGSLSKSYQVTFRDNSRKRVRRDFDTQREAKRFVEGLSEYIEGVSASKPEPPTTTFREVSAAYLDACKSGRDGDAPLERKTLIGYLDGLKNHVLPELGDKPIAGITKQDMRAYLKTVVESAISRRTMRLALFLARAVLKHARAMDLMDNDPSADMKIKVDKRRENRATREVKIHSKAEVTALLTTARTLAEKSKVWVQYEAIVHTLVYAGLRMSELRGLPCDAVDLSKGTITVRQRADLLGQIGPPKSEHAYRTIHIPRGVIRILEAWLGDRKEGLVFPTRTGKPISHSNLAGRMWRVLQERAGVTILNPHTTRHFFASMLIDQGAKMKQLQEQMGHHDPMFTMRVYGHLFRDADDIALMREMASRMEKALSDDED